MKLVTSLNLLNRLEKHGFITLHIQTGRKVYWAGGYRFAWYIEDCKTPLFQFDGKHYLVKYQSGCFNPFVYEKTSI